MHNSPSLNHTYRLIWSHVLNAWVAVAEHVRGRGKAKAHKAMAKAVSGVLGGALAFGFAGLSLADQTGGQVVSGAGTISQTANTTTITQTSQTLGLTWNTFNINSNQSVNFIQPSSTALAVNRIYDTSASQILGKLTANGQVWLINPNGVFFGQGAQINVGSLLASTLNPMGSDDDLGKKDKAVTFSGTGTGIIINKATINAAGYVVLIGNTVSNLGTIVANNGTVALGAGSQVSLKFADNQLLSLVVDASTLNNLAENKGLIQADGGTVLLSAGAKDSVLASVVNNEGVIEANTVENRAGTIVLLSGMTAGTTKVAGTLDASAQTGNGGFIETSGAKVTVADGTKVTTLAYNTDGGTGATGTWLIDPTDFTVAASGGDMTGADVNAALANNNCTIQSSSGTTGTDGNININDSISWSSSFKLTLNAYNNININSSITATNATGSLALEYGQGSTSGIINGTAATYNVNAKVNLQAGQNFSTKLGSSGSTITYTVITSLGNAGSTTTTDLQGITGNLSGNYVLGADIYASATATWNSNGATTPTYAGFNPLGTSLTTGKVYTGIFDGLGHTISNLTINRPSTTGVGLFGYTLGATIRNVGLVGGSVTGNQYVGDLVGENYSTTISNVYATGTVSGTSYVGGLIGYNVAGGIISSAYATGDVTGSGTWIGGLAGANDGTISNSYATGDVSGSTVVGGLVGFNIGSISNAYATGAVSGNSDVGGLVGDNFGTISYTYAAGKVSATSNVGGLVGLNYVGSTSIISSFWNTDTTGQSTSSAGGTGKNTAEMQKSSTFTGWSISSVGGSSSIWRIYGEETSPLLRSFLTTVDLGTVTTTYSGTAQTASSATASLDSTKVLGTAASGTNAGTYISRYYSSQQGYDFIGGGLTINKANATVTANSDTVTYNGATQTVSGFTVSGLVGGESNAVLNVAATGASGKDAGTYTSTASGTAQNYNLTFVNGQLLINKANATVTANSDTVTYNGATQTVSGFTVSGLVGGESNAVLNVAATGASGKDAGTYTSTASGTAQNYLLTFVDGQLTINKANATVTANSDTVTYNGATQTVSGFTVSGLVGGESNAVLNVAATGASGKDAGTYTSTASGTAQNYNLTFVNGQLLINKANATVTANSDTVTYNGATQTVSGFTVSGLVGGESNAVLNVAATGASGKDAGTYTSTASGTAQNYLLTFVDGQLTIDKATLSYVANNTTTPQGVTPTLSGSVTGFVGGETSSSVFGANSAIWSTPGNINVAGVYAVNGSGLTASNYDLVQAASNATALTVQAGQVGTTVASNSTASTTASNLLQSRLARFNTNPSELRQQTLNFNQLAPTGAGGKIDFNSLPSTGAGPGTGTGSRATTGRDEDIKFVNFTIVEDVQ